MRATFLGTGSALPTADRAQSGVLVEADGRALLVDCGAGTLTRLGERHEALDAVLLTHHHTDHVADLVPILKARWLAGCPALEVVGPPGTRALLADLLAVHDYLRGRVEYDAREVDPGEAFAVAGFDVKATGTVHSMPCHAYRFGDAFAVSGDTEADDSVAAFADGVEAFAHDCSFPDGVDVSNHPTPSALGEALAGNEYGTVFLTHLYPHAEGRHRELLAAVRERYDGDVRVARDGLSVRC
ncbi:MAG: MBL fold metallo-hydrolase [Halobacteriaceae archaeon]